MKKITPKTVSVSTFALASLALVFSTLVLSSCEKTSSEWILKETTPKESEIYTGDVIIHGYLSTETFYNNDKLLVLNVVDEDLKKFPESKFKNYTLKYNEKNITENTEMMNKLSKYNENSPATLRVDVLLYPQEGIPTLTLSEIIE